MRFLTRPAAILGIVFALVTSNFRAASIQDVYRWSSRFFDVAKCIGISDYYVPGTSNAGITATVTATVTTTRTVTTNHPSALPQPGKTFLIRERQSGLYLKLNTGHIELSASKQQDQMSQ